MPNLTNDYSFDAAATATGCKIEKKWLVSYSDNVNNTVMGHEYQKYMLEKIGKEWMDDPPALGSTDFVRPLLFWNCNEKLSEDIH